MGLIFFASWPHTRMRISTISLTETFTTTTLHTVDLLKLHGALYNSHHNMCSLGAPEYIQLATAQAWQLAPSYPCTPLDSCASGGSHC